MDMKMCWFRIDVLILLFSAFVHSYAFLWGHNDHGLKPGQCPAHLYSFPSRFGCSCDDNCPFDHKCCNFFCGPLCVPPIFIKAECPDIPQGHVGPCVELCSDDHDCFEGKKCCSNGCGHVCMTPKIVKPGHCGLSHVFLCENNCHDDSNCSGNKKCCPTVCGHACKTPFGWENH